MSNSGDYFAPAPGATQVIAASPSLPAHRSGDSKRRKTLLLAGVVAGIVVVAALARTVVSGGDTVADTRAIEIPASVGRLTLRSDSLGDQHREAMLPILAKIFGSKPSASASYIDPPGSNPFGAAFLLVGRGPVDVANTGDVALAAKARSHFGPITCAQMEYKEKVVTSVVVCWHSTGSFGASLLATSGAFADMAGQASALEAVIPLMRGDH